MKKLALVAAFAGLVACGSDKKPPVIDPPVDSPPGVGDACNPLTQAGCEAGEKCAWIVEQAMPRVGRIGCVPDGTVAIESACWLGSPPSDTPPEAGAAPQTGYSNCVKGSECVASVCKSICDDKGGDPKCDANNYSCSRYSGLFTSGTMTLAGVCDPKCDPLTQRKKVDNGEACGSRDPVTLEPKPIDPNQGCFRTAGGTSLDFSCARIPAESKGKLDRMPAHGPDASSAYSNGCEAGYIPLYIQQTGSMVRICQGLCAPAPTSTANPGNAQGDNTVAVKLHDEAEPAAGNGLCVAGLKGPSDGTATNCMHMWWWNIDANNNYLPSPFNNNTGICHGFGAYDLNDGQGGTVPWPSCASLPPSNGTENATYGFAWDWGCVPDTDVPPAFQSRKRHPGTLDFRLGQPEQEMVRHVID